MTFTTAGEVAVGEARFTVLEKITPTITWPTPANITFGTALGAGQLNATTGVAGAFVYTPGAGHPAERGRRTAPVSGVHANEHDCV